MERYDYRQAVIEDIREYIEDNITMSDYEDKDEAYEALYDDLWIADSVTGNGSGSYTFSTWTAEDYLCHNWDLLGEALDELGCSPDYLTKGAEALDVTIRCYLLSECLSEVLNEMFEDE